MSNNPTPVIFDCDPGHDDAIALLLALGSPELHLLGVVTSYGNQALAKTTVNALRLVQFVGRPTYPWRWEPPSLCSAHLRSQRMCTARAA